MSRWDYPKSRQIVLQGVLCVVFACSVALAALVTHERRAAGGTRLAGARYVGDIGVKLPAGWVLERESQNSHDPILFVAHEPDSSDRKGREIIIRRHRVDPNVPAEEFLQASGLLQGTERLVATDPAANVAQPITIAGDPGVMVTVIRPVGDEPPEMVTELFAASVRPSGLAISLQLQCPDNTDPESNQEMLREIGDAIDVRN